MLKLRDIIWETTLRCSKGCKYCGSKRFLRDENPSIDQLVHIAEEIGKYGVETVTLSGGEPGEWEPLTLSAIISTLKYYGCKVQVITNGLFFKNLSSKIDSVSIIGISVNGPKEYKRVKELTEGNIKNSTMVSNFGTHNIWDFDALAEIAKNFKSWQIQLTMGELMLPPDGIDYLKAKIRSLEGIKYVLSDGLQDQHKCSAGLNSCGITADGDVIPCLQERSYSRDVTVYGNLFKRSLKDIWENEFKDIRFSDNGWCNSCRRIVKYPEIKELTPTITPIEKIEANKWPEEPSEEEVEKFLESLDSSPRKLYPIKRDYRGCSGNVLSYGITDWEVCSLTDWENEIWK